MLLRYTPGTKLYIHYNPDDPSIATVKTGINGDIVWFIVAGLAFIIFAVFAAAGYLSNDIGGFKFVAVIFCSIFTLLGIGILTPGLQNLLYARTSLQWPTAKAVVVYWPEQPGDNTSEHGQQDRIDPATGYVFTYQTTPNGNPLAYMYEVDGVKYFSGLRYFGQVHQSSDNWAYDILERYPTGADIPVRYCPTDPDLAVLEPDISPDAFGLIVGGAAFILFALMVLAVTILRR